MEQELKEKIFNVLLAAYKAGKFSDREMIDIIEFYSLLEKY